jgi:putative transposase
MRKSRFTEGQMVAVIRETDRDGVPAVAKRHKVGEQTLYTWRKRFGGFQPDDVRRLKHIEQENARLKKLVAERDLEIDVIKKIAARMVSVQARREPVAYAMRRGVSQRRVCSLMNVARSALERRCDGGVGLDVAPDARGNREARRVVGHSRDAQPARHPVLYDRHVRRGRAQEFLR